jgi:poly(3-hydroxyalkanoate) synthetase
MTDLLTQKAALAAVVRHLNEMMNDGWPAVTEAEIQRWMAEAGLAESAWPHTLTDLGREALAE